MNPQLYKNAILSVKDKVSNLDYTHSSWDVLVVGQTPKFRLNDKLLSRNNSIIVGYTCLNCGVKNEITLNLYLRKVKQSGKWCNACKNADEHKRNEHVSYMKGERHVTHPVRWSEKSLPERIDESIRDFESRDDEYKRLYFARHLDYDEFERVRSKLVSVGNKKLVDLTDWEYLPTYRVWNQTQFTPMLVNRKTNAIEKPSYVEWTCDVCDSRFTNRDLEVQKNRIKIMCFDCSFSNRIFKVKPISTPYGKLKYQSLQEKRFIEWCVEHSIRVENGPRIEYEWNGKHRKYNVDFQIPDRRMLVELKDNHVWHKIQLENGKWGAKEECAKKWCEEKGWTYTILFPKTIASWKQALLESCKI